MLRMMRLIILFVLLPITCVSAKNNAVVEVNILDSPKYAALVIDQRTQSILYQHHAKAKRHPASLTKVMTLYMVFDALENGMLHLNDDIVVSSRAAAQMPSKLGLKAGEKITVQDAILALIIKSANDVATAIAEHIAGSEEKFAAVMTRRARTLGMFYTEFRNASGWHHPDQYTNAVDMSKLAIAIKQDFPEYFHFFNNTEFTYKGMVIKGHNRIMQEYPTVTGLKTGYVHASGFNLITTTNSEAAEIIAVVFGGQTAKVRDLHMKNLLDQAHQELSQVNKNRTNHYNNKTRVAYKKRDVKQGISSPFTALRGGTLQKENNGNNSPFGVIASN